MTNTMDSAVENARAIIAELEPEKLSDGLTEAGQMMIDICRAFIDSQSQVERMREALESERAKWDDDPRVFYPDNEVLESLDRLHAALTKEEKSP